MFIAAIPSNTSVRIIVTDALDDEDPPSTSYLLFHTGAPISKIALVNGQAWCIAEDSRAVEALPKGRIAETRLMLAGVEESGNSDAAAARPVLAAWALSAQAGFSISNPSPQVITGLKAGLISAAVALLVLLILYINFRRWSARKQKSPSRNWSARYPAPGGGMQNYISQTHPDSLLLADQRVSNTSRSHSHPQGRPHSSYAVHQLLLAPPNTEISGLSHYQASEVQEEGGEEDNCKPPISPFSARSFRSKSERRTTMTSQRAHRGAIISETYTYSLPEGDTESVATRGPPPTIGGMSMVSDEHYHRTKACTVLPGGRLRNSHLEDARCSIPSEV